MRSIPIVNISFAARLCVVLVRLSTRPSSYVSIHDFYSFCAPSCSVRANLAFQLERTTVEE